MASETGRQRASRIPLDYFKRPNLWERRKLRWTLVLAVLAGGWWTVGVLAGRQNAAFHSPGHLASVHRAWESNCEACHVDFRPIHDDALPVAWEHGTPEADQKCQTCHRAAEHHALKIAADAGSCSSCHREHQGTNASLVRMDDRECVRCHASIDQHVPDGRAGAPPSLASDAAHVTRFDREHHPEFVSAKTDPGHLSFSHYRHMMLGLVADPKARDDARFTLAQIGDPAQRDRYRRTGQQDCDPVQLDCGACHQPDGAGYMRPIVYESQCQACHALFDTEGSGILSAIAKHGMSPKEMQQALNLHYTVEDSERNSQVLPGLDAPDLPNLRQHEPETADRWIAERLTSAKDKLSEKYCGKCHETAAQSWPRIQTADWRQLPPIPPPGVPQVWFQHARFDHHAHQAVSCRECHARAYADDPRASRESKDVLIPARDECLKCHAPPSQSAGQMTGGVRFDCVECHRYHNAAPPLADRGVDVGNPTAQMSQKDLLAGTKHDKP